MLAYEITDFLRKDHHNDDGDNHSNDHEEDFLCEPNGSEDGVKRKDDVQQNDLNDGAQKGPYGSLVFMVFFAFHFMMDFQGAFEE